MAAPKPPTWDEIHRLIERVDEVCRESEFVRAHAERVMRRPTIWPDRRRAPKKHTEYEATRDHDGSDPDNGRDGTL